MLDHQSQTSQPMSIHADLCAHDDGHVYLYTGHVCLSFSHEEFLRLAQVVRNTVRDLQEQDLSLRQQTETRGQQRLPAQSLFQSSDLVTQLAGVLSLLQTETDRVRVAALRRIAMTLDEDMRCEVRQYARESAVREQKKEE